MFSNDEINFLKSLVSSNSVTPDESDCGQLIADFLGKNFTHKFLTFSDSKETVSNLYSQIGRGEKKLCFAGHTDVVPPGNSAIWNSDPFSLHQSNHQFFGRGMVDMKGAIFSFVIALKEYLSHSPSIDEYNITILLSGNEEGDPKNGMVKLIEWLKQNNIQIDDCIIGEPTSKKIVGDTIKVGRRGSITFKLDVFGVQGHVAYPQNAINPIDHMVKILNKINECKIDDGNDFFDPSNIEITTIDVGNPVSNVIPEKISATFNIRNNDSVSEKQIIANVESIIQSFTDKYSLKINVSARPFINCKSALSQIASESIQQICPDTKPALSTDGGTSDARLLKDICNVVEFGLLNKTAHQANEHCSIDDLFVLKQIYLEIINRYFSNEMAR